MSNLHETGREKIFRVYVPILTNLGASVVIIGAMFKILHLPNGGPILAAGLITEALLFFIGAFAPAAPFEKHYDWALAYPELLSEDAVKAPSKKAKADPKKDIAALGAMDKMLADAKLTPEVFKNFGSGMENLNKSVGQMKSVASVAGASDEYSRSLQVATKSMGDLNKSFATTVTAMKTMEGTAADSKAHQQQVQAITKNLGALNAVYEMELKDANNHLKTINKFHGNLATAVQSMDEASKEASKFKTQMSTLTTNLTQLNNVYGKMLTAMKG
ncbi:type IX secretion system motor protein PorL/GldL [Flammeovirga kamogawensis]|uniref:Gliding motility protein GldL n=1 Tax=Flammeovirga kamogawensis TaxID=373891 RepID=A0ABX8GRL8_9BACT|nr:gliding motility protein GldL [Flammeovirga kamogawensis]MBB6462669.1 gliding motility-associated protein GldL [Flammeovirga kamogawensis]QWG06093.1 gliding motility protein GldL [Flammeovirga kamogawensis]TRX67925.1 gliding motility protein GldL [Flammeovirga kamogawensis]